MCSVQCSAGAQPCLWVELSVEQDENLVLIYPCIPCIFSCISVYFPVYLYISIFVNLAGAIWRFWAVTGAHCVVYTLHYVVGNVKFVMSPHTNRSFVWGVYLQPLHEYTITKKGPQCVFRIFKINLFCREKNRSQQKKCANMCKYTKRTQIFLKQKALHIITKR